MESVQEILGKINRIYQKGIISKIDQDLILDYTRRFYEQISTIELNHSEFPAIEGTTSVANRENRNDHPDDTNEEPVIETAVNTDSDNTEPEETIEQHRAKIIPEDDRNEEAGIDTRETAVDEPSATGLTEPDEVPDEASLSDEEQLEESLMLQSLNISFEPPHPAEESPLFLQDGIEEDKAEENVLPPQTIPVDHPTPQQKEEEPVLSDYAKIFNFSSAAPAAATSDIRKKIGINDKYLFLNELFNSDKPAYEKALDYINKITQYPDAVDWVKDSPAMTYKWQDDDDTVLDFYEVLRKHFNDR